MFAWIAIGALLVVIALVVWFVVTSGVLVKSAAEGEVELGADEQDRDTLDYPVPVGQDAAHVLVALDQHGIHAEPHTRGGAPHVVVPRPDGVVDPVAWREEVRAAIGAADTSMLDAAHRHLPVRFADEQHA